MSIINKYKILPLLIASILMLTARTTQAYSVSGLVEFSYRDYETKIGQQKTSWSEFVQNYRVNAETFVLDPRFLTISGGVGYSLSSNSDGSDINSLSYNVATTFFNGMRYSWEVDAAKSTSTVSPVGAPEFDITTKMYGAKIAMNFSGIGHNGNNNNNSNNNNNGNFRNRGAFHFPLPAITLEQRHTEAESSRLLAPQNESRDETKGYLVYKLTPNINLNIDSELERYKNFQDDQAYTTKTVNLQSTWLVSPKSDLNITGRMYDRKVDNVAGFLPQESSDSVFLVYHVKEINNIEQNYQYAYTFIENPVARSKSQNGGAKMWYRFDESLRFFVNLSYSQSDYVQNATLTNPLQTYEMKTGGADVGAAYGKIYTPDWMRPFLLHTDYDFSAGFTSVSGSTQVPAGSGTTYGNNAGIGIASNGWTNESFTLDYRYSNRRDDSPAANDMWQHAISTAISTKRIPKMNVGVNGSYVSSEISSNLPNIFSTTTGNSRHVQHQTQYNAHADYTPADYLVLNAGATRSRSISQYATLSTLTPPQDFTTDETDVYAIGTLHYNVTRLLQYNLEIRRDHRVSRNTSVIRSDSDELKTWVNYRIRMVYLSFEYRIREYTTGTNPKGQEQSLMAKLSRPF